jgi:hypothetical protein
MANRDPQDPSFIEISKVYPGNSFNENILKISDPQSSKQNPKIRIKCMEECHFAVLSKVDYLKCLDKLKAKAVTKTLYFF